MILFILVPLFNDRDTELLLPFVLSNRIDPSLYRVVLDRSVSLDRIFVPDLLVVTRLVLFLDCRSRDQ